MTDPQPNPDTLPEAVPMLSYERQNDDAAMRWVVWYLGLWIVCAGAGTLVGNALRFTTMAGFNVSVYMHLLPLISVTLPAVSLAFGLGILRRRRAALYGALIVTLLSPFLGVWTYYPAGLTMVVAIVAPALVAAGLQFAAIGSIFRRADAAGVLEPAAAGGLERVPRGDSLRFLLSRIGWIIMSHGAMLVQFAIGLILGRTGATTASWDWSATVCVSVLVAVAVCGLLMAMGKRQAIWPAIGILPLLMVGAPVLGLSRAFRGQLGVQSTWVVFRHAVPGAISCAITIGLLIILARKVAQRPAGA